MRWNTYSSRFTSIAQKNGYTQWEIDHYLLYAQGLFNKRVPVIFDQKHLALLVGYREEFLRKVSNSSRNFYRSFTIPKKSGGERTISEPLPSLKEIQYWILAEILYKYDVSPYAKAYVQDKSIKQNARFHINQNLVLTLDIENFFGSLKFHSVYFYFSGLGYTKSVATMLSRLCCLDNSLPQGAPTSPALSNILMHNVDNRISGYTRRNNIFYTRYADDMTFSGNFEPGMIIDFVSTVLDSLGLRINQNKIRERKHYERQEVTGIIVNTKMQAPREYRRKIRQEMYYINKFGFSSHLNKIENNKANYLYHLLGKINHILFINPKDQEAIKYREMLQKYLPKMER